MRYKEISNTYPFEECEHCFSDCNDCELLHPQEVQQMHIVECKICRPDKKSKKITELFYLDASGGLRECKFCPECGSPMK